MGSGENPWPQWTLSRTLELMDENRIAAVAISIASPGAYFGDVEFTRRLARDCNEALARMVADRPTKFAALGFVPLPDVAAAVREVEYALDVLKLDGINLLTHTGPRYLGHPEEDELYAELDRRSAVVFVHPVRPPLSGLPQFSYAAGLTELVFDTTRAIANLLYTGTLAKYPNIRFLMSHMGGVTPFLLFRLSGLDDDPKVRERIPNGVAAYLRGLYYDVAQSAAPLSLSALLDIADPSRIFFGTDYPFARNPEKVLKDTIAAVEGFAGFADDALRRKVSYENAQHLFPRFASL
jgi:predicted TIM-barrel fold metal-dependent hydrolase